MIEEAEGEVKRQSLFLFTHSESERESEWAPSASLNLRGTAFILLEALNMFGMKEKGKHSGETRFKKALQKIITPGEKKNTPVENSGISDPMCAELRLPSVLHESADLCVPGSAVRPIPRSP